MVVHDLQDHIHKLEIKRHPGMEHNRTQEAFSGIKRNRTHYVKEEETMGFLATQQVRK